VPIRLRLALITSLFAAVLVGAGGLLFSHELGSRLLGSLDGELQSRAQGIAAALQAGAAPSVAARQVTAPQDAFVQVLRPDGGLVANSAAAAARPLLSMAEIGRVGSSPVTVDGTVPDAEMHREPVRLVATRAASTLGPLLVVVGGLRDDVDHAVETVVQELLIGGAMVVPLAGLGAWLLAGAALRPVERMRRQVAAISERDQRSSLQVPRTRDELAALGATMNGLLARLQAALARERRLVADAAHELRTPLAVLRTELELAGRRERTREELVEAVANAARETDRLVRLAEDLLFLARTDEGVPVLRAEPQHLAEVLNTAASAHAQRAAANGVSCPVKVVDDPVVMLDEARVRQAVENLLDNALRVAPPGTSIEVEARVEDGMAVIAISDDGPGFPADFLPDAFQRFRRADVARAREHGGTGLGLAIVQAIALAHGGWTDATNRPGGGARVRFAIPLDGGTRGLV
jgi:signal transduction histidine kinase